MALASAVATLLGALFLCLGTGAGTGPGERAHHERASARAASADAGSGGLRAAEVLHAADRYVCPFDRGDCSLFPSLSPAVLSAPPLDPPLHAAGRLPRPEVSPAGLGTSLLGARPRAPDLHVLQVLRT
ncbi:hypothetical protein ACIGO8_23755 [Streptomyces sp. NPDC053493]|uniref:hypothetical protein n=1 Tax=Streptomyces sp. NPDC053493 TaxID=3365705 RepID=UPI0037D67E5A